MFYKNHLTATAAVLSLAAATTASALDAGGIAIHGAVSATASYSDEYKFYGATADRLDLNVKEITLNGTYRFENGLRAAAQLFAYEVADYSALTLDFATLDYSFNEYFGVRAGRNKIPQGLYGELQDLDQVRTFASLPLAFYPRALRELSAGYNGLGTYGNIGLGRVGSLEYQLYAGYMNDIDPSDPFILGLERISTTTQTDVDQIFGGGLIWNAPVEGLRFGVTHANLPDIRLTGRLQTRAGMAASDFSTPVPAMIDMFYGAGAWDRSGLFAGQPSYTNLDLAITISSVEYTRGAWIAAVEYKHMKNRGTTTIPALNRTNLPYDETEEHWYAQVTYQITDALGFGVYYGISDYDPDDRVAGDTKFTELRDAAAAVSYAVTKNWLVKAELHAMDGLGKLSIAGDRNYGAADPTWSYAVLKTTFSF